MLLSGERSTQNAKLHIINYAFVYTIIVLFTSQCHSLKSAKFKCRLVNSCTCTFENGEGYDLSSLSPVKTGLNASLGNLTFYFHPCTDISIGSDTEFNSCYKGASICVFNSSNQIYTNLGQSNDVQVTSLGLNEPVTFVYTHNKSIATLKLKCAENNALVVDTANSASNRYELTLTSPNACRQRVYVRADPPPDSSHLSTGSVLVIMFIVFFSLYFVGGALVLKFLRGAEGREMIPNYDFWVSLPGLVKEGFVFALNGCRTPQAYDRI